MTENNNKRHRDWMLTFSCEYWTKEEIEDALKNHAYIGQQEEGKGGFLHYQVFLQAKNNCTFSAIQKKLKNAHIEPRKGHRSSVMIMLQNQKQQSQELLSKMGDETK